MPHESRKILVTGGAGFIGSHVAGAHVDRGDRVWIVDDLSSGRLENVPPGAEFHQLDIADARVGDLIRRVGFDLINHHAAQIDVRVSVADPALDARVNVTGLLNILEAARESGAGRIVFISSGGVIYGEPDDIPTPESAPKEPLSPYGVTKLAGEHYLNYYREVHGMDYVALRYGNVYGPRQDPHGEAGVVAIFCRRLVRGEPPGHLRRRRTDPGLRLRARRGPRQSDGRPHGPFPRAGARRPRLQRGHGDRDNREPARRCPGKSGGPPHRPCLRGSPSRGTPPQRPRNRQVPSTRLVSRRRACAKVWPPPSNTSLPARKRSRSHERTSSTVPADAELLGHDRGGQPPHPDRARRAGPFFGPLALGDHLEGPALPGRAGRRGTGSWAGWRKPAT